MVHDVVDRGTTVKEEVQYFEAIGFLSIYSVLEELSVLCTSAMLEKKLDYCERAPHNCKGKGSAIYSTGFGVRPGPASKKPSG